MSSLGQLPRRQGGGTKSNASFYRGAHQSSLCPRGQSAQHWEGCPEPQLPGWTAPQHSRGHSMIPTQDSSPPRTPHYVTGCTWGGPASFMYVRNFPLLRVISWQVIAIGSPFCGVKVSPQTHLSPLPTPLLKSIPEMLPPKDRCCDYLFIKHH